MVLGLLLLMGCDLFSTRDPEPPTGPNTSDIATFHEEAPELMIAAIELRDPNQYMMLIDTSLSYVPPAGMENAAFFDAWDYEKENIFVQRLLSPDVLPPDSAATLSFQNPEVTEPTADSVIYVQGYQLEYHSVMTEIPTLYQGVVQWSLVRGDDGGWRVALWQDLAASGEEATLSVLRQTL